MLPVDRLVVVACFGAALVIGLVGAFVGLETRSLWIDELFTAGFIESNGTGLLARLLGDLNPPLYYLALSFYTGVFGSSDAALRSFSAVAACAAVLVFVAGTARSFSLPARLFGAALATGSFYWFVQSQNARSYALALLISAGLLVLCLRLLNEREQQKTPWGTVAAFTGLALLGLLTHIYLVLESLAAVGLLVLLKRRDRIVLMAVGAGLLIAAALYVKLVIGQRAQVSAANFWLANDFGWYLFELKWAAVNAFGKIGRLVIVAGAAAFLLRWLIGQRSKGDRFPFDATTLLLAGVPLLMLVGAVISSFLVAPNFTGRYWLIVAPFLWALCARLYDAVTAGASRPFAWGVNLAMAVGVLLAATVVTNRLSIGAERALFTEPFRESAAWIKEQPACKGQVIPVVTTDKRAWYKPGFGENLYEKAYAHYLRGFAVPRLVFWEDVQAGTLPADLKTLLQDRVDQGGCPVLGWFMHNSPDRSDAKAVFLRGLDRPAADGRVQMELFDIGWAGYIFFADPRP